jgi:hypothetical protein
MKAIIEDTHFPAGTRIRISGGPDELLFVRCLFEGGEIFIGQEVDQMIFSQCVFRGTSFSGQSPSERIAIACHSARPDTEATAAPRRLREGKFRS